MTIGVSPVLLLLAFCKIALALGLISYAVISAGKSLHRLISIILGMALLLAS
jgi:hypothetical protein